MAASEHYEDRFTGTLPTRLNLGCGEDYREGWHNVDIDPSVEPDEVLDLADPPWGLPRDHFIHIEARHVLEHVDSVPWDELLRILEPGGTLTITYPIGHTRFEDPTHRQYWNWHTADVLAGEREHAHETDLPLEQTAWRADTRLGHRDPLTAAYIRFRRWWAGDGPWLEHVPGVYGEVMATYRYRP